MSIRSPRVYHQGWIHVKENDGYVIYYGQLRAGKVLNFYQDETKAAGSGKFYQSSLELCYLASVQTQCDRRHGIGHPMYVIILKFDSSQRVKEAKLRVKTVEERNAWVRYIRAVGLETLPETAEHLLPGQIQQLEDIIQHEQQLAQPRMRQDMHLPNGDYEKMNQVEESSSVAWYYPEVKHRKDAEDILSIATNEGNLMVRKRSTENPADDWDHAVSAVSRKNGQCTFHHFRLKWSGMYSTYEINLADGPHPPLATLEEVVAFFEKRSNNKYRRLAARVTLESNAYQKVIVPPGDTQMIYVNDPYNARKSKR